MRRRVIAFAASLSLSLGLTGVTTMPAEAHDGSDGLFKQGSDYFIHSNDGTWFKICTQRTTAMRSGLATTSTTQATRATGRLRCSIWETLTGWTARRGMSVRTS
jgi:hypothetical protein